MLAGLIKRLPRIDPRRVAVSAFLCFTMGVLANVVIGRPAAPRVAAIHSATEDIVLVEGLGSHQMQVSIANDSARRWFNQGLVLAYAFNHDAAARSFIKAAELDARCAMCWWGAAWVVGPHVNAAMDLASQDLAWERMQRAQALAPAVTRREQAYIAALARRYSAAPNSHRPALDAAYAEAMSTLVQDYPEDTDARTLYAEALMNLHPWDFYDQNSQPRPRTAEIVAELEQVLALDADHPGANHYYTYMVAPSTTPERGLNAAVRLERLAPGAGHLVHAPARIFMRLGLYHEASRANQRAIDADLRFLQRNRPGSGLYLQGYVPHHHHALYASSMMQGHRANALAAAGEVARRMDLDQSRKPGYAALQHYWAAPYFARVRFGRWAQVLAEPPPPADLPYLKAMWHYTRGMALTRAGQLDNAAAELAWLAAIAEHPEMDRRSIWGLNTFSSVLGVAERVLAGELAAASKDNDAAVSALEQALIAQQALRYDEPDAWYFPVRQSLGAVLLQAGRAAEAQAVYEADLRRHPENGWSLFGLASALKAQQLPAAEVEARFERVWQYADVRLTSSRF
ncbi:MAG: tetratricopeptide repeat protein [Panacagrimonas sp.]